MKKITIGLGILLFCAGSIRAQSKMQCRQLRGDGNDFLQANETYLNGLACRPIATASVPAAAPEPALAPIAVTIPEGTAIQARLTNDIDSGQVREGDPVAMETIEDLVVDGAVAVPKGSAVMAHVTQAVGARKIGRGGKLGISCDYVVAADDTRIRVTGNHNENGKGGYGAGSATGAVAAGLFFPPAGALLLLKHGHASVIAAGTVLTMDVAEATGVNAAAREVAPVAPPAAAAAAPQSDRQMMVVSNQDGAAAQALDEQSQSLGDVARRYRAQQAPQK